MPTLTTDEKSKGGRGVKSALSVSGFAGRLGKSKGYLTQVTQAAKVFRKLFSQLNSFSPQGKVQHLFEIHSAPEHTWPTLAALLQEHEPDFCSRMIQQDFLGASVRVIRTDTYPMCHFVMLRKVASLTRFWVSKMAQCQDNPQPHRSRFYCKKFLR